VKRIYQQFIPNVSLLVQVNIVQFMKKKEGSLLTN